MSEVQPLSLAQAERQACNCIQCASLCGGNPGWFAPGEAELAAEHMEMPFEGFFERFLIVEFWVDDGAELVVYAPRRVQQDYFRAKWSDNFLRGKCRLLGEKGCLLPLEHRPIECAAAKGCGPPHNLRKSIADAYGEAGMREKVNEMSYRHPREK